MSDTIYWVTGLLLAGAAAAAEPDLERVERIVVQRTNEFRAEEGRDRVAVDLRLERAARKFAEYMADTDEYGHTADGTKPSDRARRSGYAYCLISENIAYQFSTAGFATEELARRYVEGWKKSPGHRRNMLEPTVLETGVGVARSRRTGRYYAVQLFGRPESRNVRFRVTNRARDAVRYRVDEREFTLAPNAVRIHTQCAPERLMLLDAREEPATTAGDGDRLVVTGERGKLALRRER